MPHTRHTETPWKVAPGTGPVAICDTIENRPLCRLVYRATNGSIPYTEIERGKANAAYIVTAVNAHAELTKIATECVELRDAVEALIGKPAQATYAELQTSIYELAKRARTALRTAKGE